MTELEKARSNRCQEIDYNKLIEELHVSYHDYVKSMEENCRTGRKPGRQEMIAPTINTLFALNCFLNSTGFDSRELPLVVASIGILLDSLSDYLDDEDKAVADTIRKALAPAVTSVNVSFMKPSKPDDT